MSSNNRLRVLVAAAATVVFAAPAFGVEDLAALQVEGQRGQSAEQVRRDRYECHNWAVEQSGAMPVAVPVQNDDSSEADRSVRAERVGRAITGAAIGAGLGGLVRNGRHHSADSVLAGAAVGAAIGAATAGKARERDDAAEAEERSDYLRALTACLEGRGYSVALPSNTEATVSR
jgi:hypothetical protein